jgi:hypothetical protein
MNGRDQELPCTPTKPTGNGGTCRVDLDGQMKSEDESEEELPVAKPKRKWNDKIT